MSIIILGSNECALREQYRDAHGYVKGNTQVNAYIAAQIKPCPNGDGFMARITSDSIIEKMLKTPEKFSIVSEAAFEQKMVDIQVTAHPTAP